MREIEFLARIINERFLQQGDDALVMIEPADGLHKEQRVAVKCGRNCVDNLFLYGFNSYATNYHKLLPFFNQNDNEPNKSPKSLCSFCDYILLITCNSTPYVFLLELKRGVATRAEIQLDASKLFMEYIVRSADRIKESNSYDDFDISSIKFRRLIIEKTISNKRITKRSNVDPRVLDAEVVTCKCYKDFFPIDYCV